MSNDNRYPGIRLESTAEAIADKPPIVNPFANNQEQAQPLRPAQPKPAPRNETTQTRPEKRETERRPAQPPRIPFEGLFRPVGTKHKSAPARRVTLVGAGILLWAFSAYLSALAIQHYIPAFQGAEISTGSAIMGLAITFLLSGVELMIFKSGGLEWWGVIVAVILYGVDIWINLDGVVRLSHAAGLWGYGLGTALMLVAGIGAAVAPELFIKVGWGE